MLYGIFSFLAAASLITDSPLGSLPQYHQEQLNSVINTCREDLKAYMKGDVEHMGKVLKDKTPEEQSMTLDMCLVYATGVMDGVKLIKAGQ